MNTQSTAAATEKTYDEVPYPGGAFRVTHPCHISMVARLFGLTPPNPQKCRVLELGCAVGSNLLPMAESLPESQFLGIDISRRQIDEGQALIRESGLQNVELKRLELTELDDSVGKFDYILCHGVYSWVSREVQDAILAIGERHLVNNGIQLVSYNTRPGWSLRSAIRDMMLYHTEDIEDPREKIGQARALLNFLERSKKGPFEAYETLIKEEATKLAEHGDYYLYHEQLEAQNDPLYFHEFVRRADAAGLRYLADTAVPTMMAQMYDEEAVEILKGVPLVRREQYMDFLNGRMFRSSLLCHQQQQPDYRSPPTNLLGLHIRLTAPLRINAAEQAGAAGEVVWDHRRGQLRTREPITSVFRQLNERLFEWTPIANLIDEETRGTNLLEVLVTTFVQGLTVLSNHPPQLSGEISETPKVSALARLQARLGRKVTNRMHDDLLLQPQQRLFASFMDGTKSQDELADILRSAVTEGKLKISRDDDQDVPTMDPTLAKRILETEILRFRNVGLLVN